MNSSTSLQIFNFEEKPVRTTTIDGEPWWVLVDVCACLGVANHRDSVRRLDKDDVDLTDVIDSIGREQKTYVVNESGLYDLILRSDKPKAREFRRWITKEVLPSIRKTGKYSVKPEETSPWKISEHVGMEALDRFLSGQITGSELAATAEALREIRLARVSDERLTAPPQHVSVAAGSDPNPEETKQLILAVAASLEVGTLVDLEVFDAIAREMDLWTDLRGIAGAGAKARILAARAGRRLAPWHGVLLMDSRGRGFRMYHDRTNRRKYRRFAFELNHPNGGIASDAAPNV